jgi:hypothetical protein
VRWKTKSQASLDDQTFASVTQPTCNGASGYVPTTYLPTDISGLKLWLDASDTATVFFDTNCTNTASVNGKLRCWTDKSGNNNNATQPFNPANGNLNPSWQGTNVYFDGNRTYIATNNFLSGATITGMDIFMVMNTASNIDGYTIHYPASGATVSAKIPNISNQSVWQIGGNTFSSAWGASLSTKYIWNLSFSSSVAKVWRSDSNLNNSATSISSFNAGNNKNIYFGCDSSTATNNPNATPTCSNININEILIYNTMLSDDDRLKVNYYLRNKWEL